MLSSNMSNLKWYETWGGVAIRSILQQELLMLLKHIQSFELVTINKTWSFIEVAGTY